MRFLLTPNRSEAYGQDFLAKSMQEQCGLFPLTPNIDLPSTASLLVSQNPDSTEDADAITSAPSSVPAVVHVHCQYSYYNERQQRNIERCLSRAVVGIAPAQFSASELANLFPEVAWHTVYNGVDSTRFRPRTAEERRSWRHEHGIPQDDLLIGFVGRLEAAKGLQILEEFARLSAGSKIHLVLQFLAHTDSSTVRNYADTAQRIQQSAIDRVSLFPDFDLSTDRPICYFDALLTPSLSEVCPLVVLEAFRSGVPVLATNATPFYSELEQFSFPSGHLHLVKLSSTFGNSRSQLSVTSGDATKLALEFIEIVSNLQRSDDDYRAKLSESADRAHFTQQHMLAVLNDIYGNVTNGT